MATLGAHPGGHKGEHSTSPIEVAQAPPELTIALLYL